jgi:23S rRNA (uracil1939-C5)-methyltransferase
MSKLPVKAGQQVRLKIETISHQGEGVAKLDGYTVFVPYAAPGDQVIAEVVSAKKDYARAIIREIETSGQRVEPKCPWYSECGGCNLQHLDYRDQLRVKTETVKSTLMRIGGISPGIVRPALPTRPWSYRNKLQAPVGLHRGELTAGMYKPRSHDLVPVTDCAIQHQPNNAVAREIVKVARETGIAPWNEETHRGTLRHVVVRRSELTRQTLVTLVVSKLDFPRREEFLNRLKEQIRNVHSLVLNENPRPTNVILGDREEVIWGPGYITDRIGDLQFKISSRSFWQVNPEGTEKIYEKVKEFAQLTGEKVVLDIYCGTGSIGLYLADQAGKVIGIERNFSAIQDARDNACLNGLANAEFHAGRAEDVLPKIAADLTADVVILDPPRKGCDATMLEAVVKISPERIIYVSCNPATLARDLKILEERGYLAQEVQPIDMFPHTNHVETVVLMSRVKE